MPTFKEQTKTYQISLTAKIKFQNKDWKVQQWIREFLEDFLKKIIWKKEATISMIMKSIINTMAILDIWAILECQRWEYLNRIFSSNSLLSRIMEEDIKCKIAIVKLTITDSQKHQVELEIKLGKINNKCFDFSYWKILTFRLKIFILIFLIIKLF